jgi:hypothetical protein
MKLGKRAMERLNLHAGEIVTEFSESKIVFKMVRGGGNAAPT